jgi:hypothetical protein
MRLVRWGMNDCQISRLTGVPRGTVCGWRHQSRTDDWEPGRGSGRFDDCPICQNGSLDDVSYSYLLGMYLGDGYVVQMPRTMKLSIALDAKYPGIIYECTEAIAKQRAQGVMKVGVQSYDTWVVVTGHWKHWTCLFPQHGKGMKHLRPIKLRSWQKLIVDTYPRQLLRGLIQSDGCRFTNPVWRQWRPDRAPKLYKYPRYHFTNASSDIRQIFCDACDVLGIPWKQSAYRTISVARREGVALLDEFVGPKR